MIPLQSTTPVKSFPRLTSAICVSFVALELVSRCWPGSRAEFLERVTWAPTVPLDWRFMSAAIFFPNLISLLTQTLFVWVFSPRLFERRGSTFALISAIGGIAVSLGVFALIYRDSSVPMLVPEALVGAWLGAYMRRDIWGTVNTLVPGPGWIRVLEVPSYVQLFFWFFYQLIANLFLPEALGNAPMPYAIGLVAFLWGFIFDSVWGAFFNANSDPATPA